MSDPGVNDQQNGAQPADESHVVSPGARLAAYRKERGWTVEQVASQLNLAPRQIVAIESDDYPALPGMPIVRGFVRAYAKLLKVDAAPLLATLGGETVLVHNSIEPRKTLSTPFSEARLPSMTERQPLSSKWVVGILLAVLAGVAVWAARHEYGSAKQPATASPPVTEAASSSVVQESQGSANVSGEQAGVAPPMTSAPNTVASGAPTAATDTTAAVSATATPGSAASPASPSAEAGALGKDMLEVTVREDSWVEIRRASNNAVLLSRIVKAGERENIEVSEPVSVVVGNAAGVDLSLRGAPVDVKPKTNSNVARLSLK